MAMFVCADPPKTCKASVWLTPRVPFFKKCACWNSAPAMPPSAVPKLTPTRGCGSSGEHTRPASSSASRALATENCA